MWIVSMKNGCSSIECPRCGAINVINVLKRKNNFVPSTELNRNSAVEQIEYSTDMECTCSKCGSQFVVDFGKTEYSIYDPANEENDGEKTWLVADFRSDYEGSYEIYKAQIPGMHSKFVHYIMTEKSRRPILLSTRQLNNFLHDRTRTLKFLKQIKAI